MAFNRFTKNVLNVSALPDRVQNQAQALKATFDQAGVDIKEALNALITELEVSSSASNIGADVQSVATKTVQAILTAFEEAIANRYTKLEADTLLSEGTNELVSNFDIDLNTGVITITRKDGTVETFDTALEKVPAKFELVEENGKYALKITNVDGTTTQTDVTNLMNIYNFDNGDSIAFEVDGEGSEKTVTARIRANSIGLEKLELSVVSTLEGYMTSAKDSASAAKTSETNARNSELNALEAKNIAVTKAQEASTSASNAKTSETNAKTSEINAEYWAKQVQAGGGGITEIPVASADTLGGIKVGEGLEITEDGKLSTLDGIGDVHIIESTSVSANFIETTPVEGEILQFTNITGNMTVRDGKKIVVKAGQRVQINAYISYTERDSVYEDGNMRFMIRDFTNNKDIQIMQPYNSTDRHYEFSHSVSTQYTNETDVDCEIGVICTNVWAQNTVSSEMSGITVFEIGLQKYTIKTGEMEIDSTPTAGSTNLVTSGGVKTYVDNQVATKANTSHNQEASTITAGTLAGEVKANATAVANVGTAQVRNIQASTTDLTAGTSALTTGEIYYVYE